MKSANFADLGKCKNFEHFERWMPEPDSGVADATPDMPERVVGKDGKSYTASAPKPTVFATSDKEQEREFANFATCGIHQAQQSPAHEW